MPSCGWRQRLRRLVHLLKVETHGQYSAERVLELDAYIRRTSRLRHVGVLMLTPVPSLLTTLALEFIPLDPPYAGMDANPAVLARSFALIGFMALAIFYQFAHFMPMLRYSRVQHVLQSVFVPAGEVSICYCIGRYLGFPIPFTLIVAAPIFMVFVAGTMALTWGRDFYDQYRTLQQPMIDALKVWRCQFGILGVYPVYYYVYSLLSSAARTALSLSLPIVKLLMRAWFSASVGHLREEIPEVVVMNVDVFNALFMTYCMQMTPSLVTTGGLMALDFAQSFLSLVDMNSMLPESHSILSNEQNERGRFKEAVGLLESMNGGIFEMGTVRTTYDLGNHVASILPRPARIRPHPGSVPSNASCNRETIPSEYGGKQPIGCHQENSKSNSMNRRHRAFVQTVQRALFASEYLLLVNYVEVIIPTMFATYVAVVYHLPNRQYLKYIDSMNADHFQTTLFSLYFYSFMEMISLLVLHFILEYKFQLPGLATLAFVFEKQWGGVQMKLLLWVMFNSQPPLEHYGYDYTFRRHVDYYSIVLRSWC